MAALEEGIITPSTIIEDKGIYTYYVDPQPMCWIWRQAHTTHGRINVSQAIVDSCNYFYYEVGRLTGIKKLDEYATAFGLGQSTGIEIGDVSGVLASPGVGGGPRPGVDRRPDHYSGHRPVLQPVHPPAAGQLCGHAGVRRRAL